MDGWVRTYRQIQKHWIWDSDEPYDMRSAWLYLILNANYKDSKVVTKNKSLIPVERGQIYTSVRKLAEHWKWSNGKVLRFLDMLQRDGMLIVDKHTNGTLLTIVNYGVFQDCQNTDGNTDGTETERIRNADGTQTERRRNTDGTLTEHSLYNIYNNNNFISMKESKERKEIKEGEEYKNINTICSEPEKPGSEQPVNQSSGQKAIPENPVISLTLNDNSEFEIFQKDVDEWKDLYPGVDVMQELRNMKGWCREHKANRKTRRGIRIFINNWLSRDQNRGGRKTMSGVEAFINGNGRK